MSDHKLQQAQNLISPFAEFAYLMGSYDTVKFTSESDVDIAVYFRPNIKLETKSELLTNLEALFNCDVDLVELNKIDPIFSRQILETGRLIINQNPDLLLKWKAVQTSLYFDFKKSREIIEKNLLHRKSYG